MSERPYITTFSGLRFYLDRLEDQEVRLVDVAAALSVIQRWIGHSRPLVPVAFHVLQCQAEGQRCGLPRLLQWHLLMHDLPEFVTGDCPSGVKRTFFQEAYRVLEDRLLTLAYRQWGLPLPTPAERDTVRAIDRLSLEWERFHVMRNRHWHWVEGGDSLRLRFTLTARRLYDELRLEGRNLPPRGLQPEEGDGR